MTDPAPQPTRTRFAAIVADLAPDVAAIVGSSLIVYGVSLVCRPAAFIVAGGFILCAAWLFARKGA
jgi:hypothetical protein